MLNLHEELFILALHEEKCSVLAAVEENLGYGLSAAILAELALMGKLRMDEKRRLELADVTQTGDAILDESIAQIKAAERPRKIAYFLSLFSEKPKKLNADLVARLVQEGVLTLEEKRLSWVIPSPFHPEENASTKYAIKTYLRAIVMTCKGAGQKEIALLNIMNSCGLLEGLFFKDELKMARRRIYELLVGEAFRSPNFQIIEELRSSVDHLCEED
jgi:Golgi phosphoprotein 3